MANQITPLSNANTFGDWVTTTNQTLAEVNDIGANNYTKNGGTLLINSAGTGLQVANNSLFQGTVTISGTGSSAVVQNQLTVQGQIISSNTQAGVAALQIAGMANVANVNITGAGVGLNVSNSSILSGNVTMGGTLSVASTTRVASLNSNTHVTSTSLYSTTAQVGSLVSNTSLVAGSVVSNTSIVTGTIVSSTSTVTGALVSNTSVVTGALVANTSFFANTITANLSLTSSASIDVATNGRIGGNINTNSISANSYVNTASLITSTSRSDYLGVGVANPGVTIGTIYAANDISAFYSSDANLKENVETIQYAVDIVNNLSGVRFDWNDKAREMYPERTYRDIGVIAQEVENVLPEIVTTRENGYKAVKYEKIIPVLIQAIKELKAEIDELKKK